MPLICSELVVFFLILILDNRFHFVADDDATLPPSRTASMRTTITDLGNSFTEDHESDGMCNNLSKYFPFCYTISF